MITKENPVQTCDMDRHKVHETLIKLIPLSTKTAHKMMSIGINTAHKKCHICIKTQ